MLLWVGLGNPGRAYALTRHNAGFIALDAIMARYDFPAPRQNFSSLFAQGYVGSVSVAALKPQTFMNRSGFAVQQAAHYYKIPPENITVFHDEIDLPFGKVRVKQSGGAAGHNGVRSLAAQLGDAFYRVRIGVAYPAGGKDQVSGHVLSNFTAKELQQARALADIIAAEAVCLAQNRADAFANRVHLAWQKHLAS